MKRLAPAAAFFVGISALASCGTQEAAGGENSAPSGAAPARSEQLLIEPPPVMDAGVVPVARPDAAAPKM